MSRHSGISQLTQKPSFSPFVDCVEADTWRRGKIVFLCWKYIFSIVIHLHVVPESNVIPAWCLRNWVTVGFWIYSVKGFMLIRQYLRGHLSKVSDISGRKWGDKLLQGASSVGWATWCHASRHAPVSTKRVAGQLVCFRDNNFEWHRHRCLQILPNCPH